MNKELKLKRMEFSVIRKQFKYFGNDGFPKYDYRKEIVNGEVFRYKGLEFGIYRTMHLSDTRRKYDYVLVDLFTGIALSTAGRKIALLTEVTDSSEIFEKIDHLRKNCKTGGENCNVKERTDKRNV